MNGNYAPCIELYTIASVEDNTPLLNRYLRSINLLYNAIKRSISIPAILSLIYVILVLRPPPSGRSDDGSGVCVNVFSRIEIILFISFYHLDSSVIFQVYSLCLCVFLYSTPNTVLPFR